MSEQVTIDEVIRALELLDAWQDNRGKGIAQRVIEHGIAPPDGYVLVPIEDCRNCDNSGVYYDNYGDVCQCQFCDVMPHSRFNQNKAMLSAVKEKG